MNHHEDGVAELVELVAWTTLQLDADERPARV